MGVGIDHNIKLLLIIRIDFEVEIFPQYISQKR